MCESCNYLPNLRTLHSGEEGKTLSIPGGMPVGPSSSSSSKGESEIAALLQSSHSLHCQLQHLLESHDGNAHYGVHFDVVELARAAPHMLHWLVDSPADAIPRVQACIRAEQLRMSASTDVKQLVHPRINLYRLSQSLVKPTIADLRAHHCGALLTISGTVIRAGPTKLREHAKQLQCEACKGRFNLPIDSDTGQLFTKPASCPLNTSCTGRSFTVASDSEVVAIDYQEIKLQEQVSRLQLGSTPRTLTAVLEGDLVDSLQAGDDADIVGYLFWRMKAMKPNARPDVEQLLHANNTRSRNTRKTAPDVPPSLTSSLEVFWRSRADCPMRARDSLLRSICPQMFGMYHAKLAVALCLLGGSPANGTRSESHILLVGDPGTGKSQLMKFACRLSQRAIVTTGMGSTSAGLTVTAVKDSNSQWALEAGALVLADGGLCCIDELSGLKNADRGSMLEAMEQQTLSIAKAGLVTRLSTKTSILAATNPKRPFDPLGSLSENTGISSPLLSRFDACVPLLDRRSREQDDHIADHILAAHMSIQERNSGITGMERVNEIGVRDDHFGGAGNHASHGASVRSNEEIDTDDCFSNETQSHKQNQEHWCVEELRQYFALVRDVFRPQLSPRAERMLQGYYALQRQQTGGNGSNERTSVRMLEGLARLTQAHAKLCFRHSATSTDAVVAIQVIEGSLTGSKVLSADAAIGNEFMDEPDAGIAQVEKSVEAAITARLGNDYFEPADRIESQAKQYNEQREREDDAFGNKRARSDTDSAAALQNKCRKRNISNAQNKSSNVHRGRKSSSAPGESADDDNDDDDFW